MKSVKTFYLTKEFIQKELGVEKVEVAFAPVTLINNVPLSAKIFKWNSFEELKNDDLFKDIKALNGLVYFYEMDTEQYKKFNELITEANYEEENPEAIIYDWIEDYNKAEIFFVRLFTV
jgi:hypothetical protein